MKNIRTYIIILNSLYLLVFTWVEKQKQRTGWYKNVTFNKCKKATMLKVRFKICKKSIIKLPYITICYLVINVLFCTSLILAQEWKSIVPIFETSNEVSSMNGIFLDENNGWLTSNWPDSGRIWQTTNGGRNWRVSRKGELAYLTIINFFDRLNGFVKVETFNKPRKHYVLKTNNGGNTWREIAVPNFTAITYLDTLNGFAGAIDAIYQTTDGGYSWLPVRVDTNAVFYITKFYFFNEDNGWASGINMHYTDTGILLNTTDGGKTWHIRMAQAYLIHDIEFVDSLNGVIVGGNMRGAAKIQVTNDGGITWVTHHLYGPTLTDIEFIDKNHGWAIGYYGFIFKTNDGGENWEKVESGTDEHLVNMCFVENGTVGYIFCSNKTLLKYDRETDIDDGSPNIIVSYNYPNPFIKSTILTYRLLENDNINISIYDITGRLVENLYSGLQEQGVHSVNWNPSNISSGIYFFHIKTSRSTEVRKVLLLN